MKRGGRYLRLRLSLLGAEPATVTAGAKALGPLATLVALAAANL